MDSGPLLRDKTALVTGAAGGFGTAVSLTLAEQGATVALLDVEADAVGARAQRLRGLGAYAVGFPADLRDEDRTADVVEQIVAELGRIDVLVNAAGVLRDRPAADVTPDDWACVTDVNLRGTFLMCQLVGRHMVAAGGGSIVNVTSIAAHTAAPNRSVYAITKAGIRSLTQQLAVEWGPYNVRCNSVYFGGLPWAMKGYELPEQPSLDGLPLGRLGRPAEFANAVVFLASDLATYVNGAELVVDGGRSLSILSSRPTSQVTT